MKKFETDKYGHIVDIFNIDVPPDIRNKPWKDLRIGTFDIEGTSIDYTNPNTFRIIQFAVGIYSAPDGDGEHEPDEFYNWFINTGIKGEDGAIKVHGCYHSEYDDPDVIEEHGKVDVADEPPFEKVVDEIRQVMLSCDVWCAYNHPYDVNGLNAELMRCDLPTLLMPCIDPWPWYMRKKGWLGLKKRGTRLEDAGRSFGCSTMSALKNENKALHDARTDIQLLNDVFWKMGPRLPQYTWHLLERQSYLLQAHMEEMI